MGKKTFTVPNTNAETAEKRLEELINHKVVTTFEYCDTDKGWVKEGECRAYPDGFEAVIEQNCKAFGYLRVERRNFYVCYDLEMEHEKQNVKEGVK